MNESDVKGAMDGIVEFIALLWNEVVMPLINGIGALFDMLPPVALGIIAAVLGVIWLFRKARHG